MSVRGPARFPAVALTVAVMAEGAVGSGWQPSPHNSPGPLAWGPLGELGVPGQAAGCVLCSSRAPGPAALGTSPPSLPPRSNGRGGLLMAEVVFKGPSLWRPQQLEYVNTAIQVPALASFGLSPQVSKLGPA